jgi:hypothetical protein
VPALLDRPNIAHLLLHWLAADVPALPDRLTNAPVLLMSRAADVPALLDELADMLRRWTDRPTCPRWR